MELAKCGTVAVHAERAGAITRVTLDWDKVAGAGWQGQMADGTLRYKNPEPVLVDIPPADAVGTGSQLHVFPCFHSLIHELEQLKCQKRTLAYIIT